MSGGTKMTTFTFANKPPRGRLLHISALSGVNRFYSIWPATTYVLVFEFWAGTGGRETLLSRVNVLKTTTSTSLTSQLD